MEFGFLPRDAVFVVSRCRSVRLSFTFIYCIQTAEHVVKLLPRPGSPIILFYDPNADTEQQGDSRGWENLRFSTEVAVYFDTR